MKEKLKSCKDNSVSSNHSALLKGPDFESQCEWSSCVASNCRQVIFLKSNMFFFFWLFPQIRPYTVKTLDSQIMHDKT